MDIKFDDLWNRGNDDTNSIDDEDVDLEEATVIMKRKEAKKAQT